MPYVGRVPSAVPVTADDIPANSIDASKIIDGAIAVSDVADNAITEAKIADAAVVSLKSGRKNLIINGAMRVQQRGTASVTSGYFVDRFQLSGGSASAVLTSSTPTEFPTAISVSATSGNPIVIQKIESESCQHLSGQTVTASFYAKNISNATTLYAKLAYAGSVDNFGSSTTISEQNLGALSGSWVKYTASWTVPSGGLNGLMLNILCDGTSTFTMGVTGIQLELGSVATDFEHRSYGEELALCERYYWRLDRTAGGANTIATGSNFSASIVVIFYPRVMRTSPTIAKVGTNYALYSNSTSYGAASFIGTSSGTRQCRLLFALSGTRGHAFHLDLDNDDTYFTYDAEL